MRLFVGISLVISWIGFAGCSEITRTGERTSSVDVVGEPADPTPDTMSQADILGSAVASPEDRATNTAANAGSYSDSTIRDMRTESTQTDAEPDVAGGLGLAKPVSLKTNKPENPSNEQSKP